VCELPGVDDVETVVRLMAHIREKQGKD